MHLNVSAHLTENTFYIIIREIGLFASGMFYLELSSANLWFVVVKS